MKRTGRSYMVLYNKKPPFWVLFSKSMHSASSIHLKTEFIQLYNIYNYANTGRLNKDPDSLIGCWWQGVDGAAMSMVLSRVSDRNGSFPVSFGEVIGLKWEYSAFQADTFCTELWHLPTSKMIQEYATEIPFSRHFFFATCIRSWNGRNGWNI